MNKNIGDMTKEELYELCNELLDKDTELIQRRIDKAIKYINNKDNWFIEFDPPIVGEVKDIYVRKQNILEILGDKENE